jgi:hypothetical protein
VELSGLPVLYVLELVDVPVVLHNLQHTADQFRGQRNGAFFLSVRSCIFHYAHGVIEWIALHFIITSRILLESQLRRDVPEALAAQVHPVPSDYSPSASAAGASNRPSELFLRLHHSTSML